MDKSVLVTGGNSEIGQKIVLELLKNGYYVIFTWYSNLKKLENLEESISCYEDKYRHYKCDLRKRNEIDSLFTFIESLKYPHLVGIVNNVGISGNKCKLSDMNIQEINEIFEVNVFSLMAVIKKGINSISKKTNGYGGSIVNISSQAAIYGGKNLTAYASSKGAVNSLSIALSKELGAHQIRVNVVSPGAIDTSHNRSKIKSILPQIPLGRMGTTSDVANVVSWLISENSDFINGIIIPVSGGR